MPAIEILPIDELVVDDTIDPRSTERSEARIKDYADNIENLPPILIDSGKRILDGIHRYKAHLLAEKSEIRVQSVNADTRQKALIYAAKYNSRHGVNLRTEELKNMAIELFHERATDDAIAEAISRSKATVHSYLKNAKEEWKADAMERVADLAEEGLAQKEIAKQVSENGARSISQETVSEWLRKQQEAKEAAAAVPEEEVEEDETEVESPPAETPTPAPSPDTGSTSYSSVSDYLDETDAFNDGEEEEAPELAGLDIPDVEEELSDKEFDASIPKRDYDHNRMKNETFVHEFEELGALDEIHMDVVNAIGVKGEYFHLYCGDEFEAFLEQDWDQAFVRSK